MDWLQIGRIFWLNVVVLMHHEDLNTTLNVTHGGGFRNPAAVSNLTRL
jgi:hypothetical protein